MRPRWEGDLSTGKILLTEKKYDIDGEKRFYFSELFLECHAPMSQKTRLEKYQMAKEVVEPRNEATVRKFRKQRLVTDTGIEITIPMAEYGDPDRVEFIANEDGTVLVLIKNIGHLSAR